MDAAADSKAEAQASFVSVLGTEIPFGRIVTQELVLIDRILFAIADQAEQRVESQGFVSRFPSNIDPVEIEEEIGMGGIAILGDEILRTALAVEKRGIAK